MHSRLAINVVGCHAEGEVGDVIVGGVLPPAGHTMMERMITMERDHDHIRQLLICEPRGSVARHVNLIVPPITQGCAAGCNHNGTHRICSDVRFQRHLCRHSFA
jgi:trans-L-3-hydroxyproline dehydratase